MRQCNLKRIKEVRSYGGPVEGQEIHLSIVTGLHTGLYLDYITKIAFLRQHCPLKSVSAGFIA